MSIYYLCVVKLNFKIGEQHYATAWSTDEHAVNSPKLQTRMASIHNFIRFMIYLIYIRRRQDV